MNKDKSWYLETPRLPFPLSHAHVGPPVDVEQDGEGERVEVLLPVVPSPAQVGHAKAYHHVEGGAVADGAVDIPEGRPSLEHHGGVGVAQFADTVICETLRTGADGRVARARPENVES